MIKTNSVHPLTVRSLTIGNSGLYNPINVRGYEATSDKMMMEDVVARLTQDGSVSSNLDKISTEHSDLFGTSAMTGASLAVEGSLSEQRNIFHLAIDEGDPYNPISKYLVTGYVAPGGMQNGTLLPNATFHLNNVLRYQQGRNGWRVVENILTTVISSESTSPISPLDRANRTLSRLTDVTKAYQVSELEDDNDTPLIVAYASGSSKFVDQKENNAGMFLGTMADAYRDTAQHGDEPLSTSEMLNRAAKRLDTNAAGSIVSFLNAEAGLTNGMCYWSNLREAFNIGPHNLAIVNDGSRADLHSYSNPNDATEESRIAYTVVNNFGNAALGLGIVVAEFTFTTNAHIDPRYGVPFAFAMDSKPRFGIEDTDELHAVDSMIAAIIHSILPHLSHNYRDKLTVKVQYGAYKDVFVHVDIGHGFVVIPFPVSVSSGFNLAINGSHHNLKTLSSTAKVVSGMFGIGADLNKNPIGMSNVDAGLFASTPSLGVSQSDMPSTGLRLGGGLPKSNNLNTVAAVNNVPKLN